MKMQNLKCLIPLATSVVLVGCGDYTIGTKSKTPAQSAAPTTDTDSVTPVGVVSVGVISGDVVSKDVVSEDVVSKDVVSEDVVSEDVVSVDVVSKDVVSEDVVSEDVVSEDVVSEDVVSEDVVSEDVVSVDPSIPVLTLSFTPTKVFRFSWVAVTGATSYKIKESITVGSGYETIHILATTDTTATSFDHIVPLYARLNAKYILQSCNAGGCTDSAAVFTSTRVDDMVDSIGYFKASNTAKSDVFGTSVSLSADGNTLAVGAIGEDSNSKVINTGEDDNSASNAGAVYVFTRNNTSAAWSEQAYLKASNADSDDIFGFSVSLSADGNTLAVGAAGEGSNGIGGQAQGQGQGQANNLAAGAGAAYVFTRTATDAGEVWSQQAYLKASHADAEDNFGGSVSLSADGNTLAVGAHLEDSNATDVVIDDGNNDAADSGAVYVFIRTGVGRVEGVESSAVWSAQAYLKAGNTDVDDEFGRTVSLSADGNTLAVGADNEDSNATGLNGDETNNNASNSGAVYVFTRTLEESGATWSAQAYLKANNTDVDDEFGRSVSLSADGNTLAVGAHLEDSNATGVDMDENNDAAADAGAVYVFIRTGVEGIESIQRSEVWTQQAYLKASNTGGDDHFGHIVSLSDDGNTLAVGALGEASNAAGINGDETNDRSTASSAVYTYIRSATSWSAQAYIKASNPNSVDQFGKGVALSADGSTLAVGAHLEDGDNTGVNEDNQEGNNAAPNSGAVYLY